MSRIALMVRYLGGVILGVAVLWIGLSMPKTGWRALSESLPGWLTHFETSVLVAVSGVALIALSTALDWQSGLTGPGKRDFRLPSIAKTPRVWCLDFPGSLDVFAAYSGAEDTPEARRKRIQSAGKNRLGQQLEANDFPLVLQAMVDPPDPLPDYCYISGQFPMVSPRLAKLLGTLDMGNGAFYEAQFYTEDGAERLPWSHAFWNIGNRKESFLAEHSDVQRVRSPRIDQHGIELYGLRGGLEDDLIAVGPEALEGSDVWVDPKLSNCLFFSDRFARLMRKQGLLDLFDLKTVRVILSD